MGQLVRFVAAHEVGHTLGLPHNFGSSSAYTVAQLRSPAFTAAHGTAPSIMDYARFNYVAQPGDGVTQLMPRIGEYDRWAIEWGYRWFPDTMSDDDVRARLTAMATARAADPAMRFGAQTGDPVDPRAQAEDLSSDGVEASRLGLANLKRIVPELTTWTTEPGEDYATLAEVYGQVVGQWARYLGHVGRIVGGVEGTARVGGEGEPVYVPVAAERQRAAVAFLLDEGFARPSWLLDPALLAASRRRARRTASCACRRRCPRAPARPGPARADAGRRLARDRHGPTGRRHARRRPRGPLGRDADRRAHRRLPPRPPARPRRPPRGAPRRRAADRPRRRTGAPRDPARRGRPPARPRRTRRPARRPRARRAPLRAPRPAPRPPPPARRRRPHRRRPRPGRPAPRPRRRPVGACRSSARRCPPPPDPMLDLSAAHPDVLVLVGTQTGNSEIVAAALAETLGALGFAAHVLDMAEAVPEDLAGYRQLVAVTCTWSGGTFPDNAVEYVEALDALAPDLAGLAFGVVGLGDRDYDPFYRRPRSASTPSSPVSAPAAPRPSARSTAARRPRTSPTRRAG